MPKRRADTTAFIDWLRDAALVVDTRCRIRRSNAAFSELLGERTRGDLTGQLLTDICPAIGACLDQPFRPDDPHQDLSERTFEVLSGQKTLIVRVQPFFDGEQHLLGIEHVDATASATDGQNFLELVLESIPSRVFWKDRAGRYIGCNHVFAKDAGLSDPTMLIGLDDTTLFPSEGAAYMADDEEVMRSGEAKINIEEPQTTPQGEEIWLSTNKVPIRDGDGRVVGIMGSYTEITERVKHRMLIEEQARRDHLTALPNRLALQERLDAFGERSPRGDGGLLFIDLDHFKVVNDTLGHDVGDRLLVQVARRISDATADRALVARIGGDEFSVFLDGDTLPAPGDAMETLRDIANDIRTHLLDTFKVELHTIRLGVSIGIARFRTTASWSQTFDEADIAMYEAKANGRNSVMCFDESMRARLDRVHCIQARLEEALANDEFYLQIQPQYGADGRWLGGEALLRWTNAELGQVSPGDFIPICEQSGFIHRLGLHVFESAFRIVADWSARFGRERLTPLAVNVSARQFARKNFNIDVEALLERYRIDPALIQFELTESLLLDNQEEALEKLSHLARLGFSTAIDDFGTGYSSLSYISKLPIGKLKIDQQFTQSITSDTRQAAIVETIITMSENLGMGVIAEGVETRDQRDMLQAFGCREFQGYLFDRPLDIDDYERLITDTRDQNMP